MSTGSSGRRAFPSVPWQAQFVLLGMIWGSSFVSIKVLDEHWPPLDVALGRVLLGALTLLAVLAWRRERLPSGRRLWAHLFVVGALWNALPFLLIAYGETQISSILAGLWNGTTPLLTVVVVLVAFPAEEKPTRERMAGLAIGFAGVLLVLGPWRGLGSEAALGQLACIAAAACYAVAIPYSRRHLMHRSESGVALTAGQLLCATAQLAVFAPLVGVPTSEIGVDGLAAILMLGIVCTGIAFVIMYMVIRAAGMTTASTVTYLIPIFSTLLGVLLLGEGVHANEPLGALVVLLGIAVTQGRLRRA